MNKIDKTRNLLIKHYNDYPKLQIQDVFKYIYQSSFGCEHQASSCFAAANYMREEYENVICESGVIVPLDGEYSRVPLSYLGAGLKADTFAKLFCLSAKKEINGRDDLVRKLSTASRLVYEGVLPFETKEFEDAILKWKSYGYPPVHHSDIFKTTYKPSYRVIANEFISFLPLFTMLDKCLERGNVNLAIEGGSASGKTTLGIIISDVYDGTVFHMDDFFLQSHQRTAERYNEVGGNIDRERFMAEVLQPLSCGEVINYRKFDCSTMNLKEAVQIEAKKLNVFEGVYSMHPEFGKYYNFSVFLDVSPKTQKKRIQKRNAEQHATRFFDEWIPLENKYFSKTNIKGRCDLCISVG